MTDSSREARSPDTAAALLATVARLRQAGDVTRARALARMLVAQYPADVRVWRALADLAEDQAERLAALDRLAALAAPMPSAAPAQPVAEAAEVKTIVVAPPPEFPDAATTEAPALPAPIVPPARLARRYNWIGIALVAAALLIFVALLFSSNRLSAPEARLTPTPPLMSDSDGIAPDVTAAPTIALPTAEAPPPATFAPTVAPPTATAAPTATTAPTVTPRPTLAVGAVVTRHSWTFAILRPDHVVTLNGAIGALQPSGRFVLALVAIANDGDTGAPPADMFVMVDSRGNRYLPVPGASTVYLNTYGRGSHGDLSFEEVIPPGIGNVSVPVIFDVPANAQDLMLFLGESSAGWPVTSAR